MALKDFSSLEGWEFAQRSLGLQKPAGVVNAMLGYRLSYVDGRFDLGIDPLRIAVDGLALTARGGTAPMLELQAIELEAARFDLAQRELVIPTLALRHGRFAARIDEHGEIDWTQMMPASSTDEPPAAQAPWKVRVESFVLDEVAFDLRDASRLTPLRLDVGSTRIDIGLQAELGGVETRVVASSPRVDLERISWTEQDGQAPLATIERLEIAGAELDLAARMIHVPRISLTGMRFDVLWKGIRGTPSAVLMLKVEMRGSKAPAQTPVVVSQRVFAASNFSQWTRIPVIGPDYENLGELLARRVSLWKDIGVKDRL